MEVPYDINLNENHWKLRQAPVIIEKAELLNEVNPTIISDVNNILEKSLEYIYSEVLEVKDNNLISIINYHHSILTTRLRANEENSDCNCNVHPAFLIGKSFFGCQEDQKFEVNNLKTIISQYAENNTLDESTIALRSYLNSTSSTEIRFDDYYSFYIPKEEFKASIIDILENNTSSRCWLGSGSSWGCCGNYSGCCYYSNPLCFVHDAICTDCKPKGFCLPGCKPDKPVKSLSIY